MLLLNLVLPALASALFIIPQPAGPYGVSLTNLQLVDQNRTDPYSGAHQRKLPISLIQPVGPSSECKSVEQMYMPNATAHYWEQTLGAELNLTLNNTFSQLQLSLCKPEHKPFHQEYPLIFFSPGSGTARQLYHILCTNIAAHGYNVITVDGPGEPGSFVTYLDKSVQYGSNATIQPETIVDVRVQDIEFVLDQLTSKHEQHKFHNLNTSITMIFGHSLGGNTAMSVVFDDNRFQGGANLDGGIDGSPLNHTAKKPFLIFASDMPGALQHNQSTVRGWAKSWQDLLGPKWQLQIKDSTHDSFSDLPALDVTFGLSDLPGLVSVLGSIEPQEAFDIQVSVLDTLFAYLSGQQEVESIISVAKTFSEVAVVNATNLG